MVGVRVAFGVPKVCAEVVWRFAPGGSREKNLHFGPEALN
jgi:hypothetical protein